MYLIELLLHQEIACNLEKVRRNTSQTGQELGDFVRNGFAKWGCVPIGRTEKIEYCQCSKVCPRLSALPLFFVV